jgi:DNA-binding SARP family transcriptional activator
MYNETVAPSQEHRRIDMSELKLYLFGEPQLEYKGKRLNIDRQKAFALLAYIALSQYRHRRETLASLLWPDLDRDRAYAAIRTTLSSMTTLVPGNWLIKHQLTLSLNRESIWVDVLHFQSLIEYARTHQHDNPNSCEACVVYLNEAIDLYQGDFMAEFSIVENNDYNHWQTIQRESLHREIAYALRRLADFHHETGNLETALIYANRWLMLDVLHEPAHRLLMKLYAANGQRTDALRQYQQCVEILDSELASPPEEETNQLYAAIRSESNPSFIRGSTGFRSGVLPSLPSLLIGREQTLHDIKRQLGIDGDLQSTTVIQGWPGVGKSTTVAALAHDADIARSFPDGVLWTSLGATPHLLSELNVWARALGLKLTDHSNPEDLSAQLATALHDRRMLLIVDDVWQIEHAIPFKVGGQTCATIITSRFNDIAQALAPTAYNIYRLAVLSEDAGLELLSRLTPDTVKDYPVESRKLVQSLEGLPLAIQVAGRLLYSESRLGWGVSNLLQELNIGAALLEARVPSDLVKLGLEASPTIAALLRRSTATLDSDMQQRFAMLGVFVPKPATFDLGAMAAAWQTSDPKLFARILVNRGLIEPTSNGRFQMHALLVLYAQSLLEKMEF